MQSGTIWDNLGRVLGSVLCYTPPHLVESSCHPRTEEPMPRWLSLPLILALALLGAGAPTPTTAASQTACVTFPETGKQVCDRFLEYWQVNGGLAQQGLPL